MKAKFTMLTHFSQRYCKLPILTEIEAEPVDNLGIAFDGMSVTPETFGHIRLAFPALKSIFAEAIREMETKKFQYSIKDDFDPVIPNENPPSKKIRSDVKHK